MRFDFLMPRNDDNHIKIVAKFLSSLVIIGYDVLKLLVVIKAFHFLYLK